MEDSLDYPMGRCIREQPVEKKSSFLRNVVFRGPYRPMLREEKKAFERSKRKEEIR